MPIFSFPALQSLCVYLCKISIFHTSRRFHLPNLCGSTADLPTKSLEWCNPNCISIIVSTF
jgi:hypothetical protein